MPAAVTPSVSAFFSLSLSVSAAAAFSGSEDAFEVRSRSAAFFVSASISFWICFSRAASQPFGSQSPSQPHLAFLSQKQVPPLSR